MPVADLSAGASVYSRRFGAGLPDKAGSALTGLPHLSVITFAVLRATIFPHSNSWAQMSNETLVHIPA